MPVKFIKERKKQKYLAFAVGVVIVVAALVLWWGYFREEEPPRPIGPGAPSVQRKIKINFETLKNPFLKEMQPFPEIPDYEGEVGRKNPFLPY